jgi:hypothetical protein
MGTVPNFLCPDKHFQCEDGKCIQQGWVCDRDLDCKNGEDEQNCSNTCGAHEFQCNDKSQCISSAWHCDGTPDCDDRSDEGPECPIKVCESDLEFKCPEGHCIPKSWLCDGENDCASSEELSADEDKLICTDTCESNYFRCANGRCVLNHFFCDSDNDCGDYSDEPESCAYKKCPENFIHCRTGVGCIERHQLCDGTYDCADHSVELTSFCELKNVTKNDEGYRLGC